MKSSAVLKNSVIERRATVRPWGIELQIWRLVDTRTLPSVSVQLPIATLLDPADDLPPPASDEDDDTDETLEAPLPNPTPGQHDRAGDLAVTAGRRT